MQIQDNFQMDETKQHSQHLCVLKKMEITIPVSEGPSVSALSEKIKGP